MFGSKKILAKIINGKLVIRVGGGYMNAEEFIDQYGKIEMMKMLHMEEQKEHQSRGTVKGGSKSNIDSNTGPRASMRPSIMINASEIKDKLRANLMSNMKQYDSNSKDKTSKHLGSSLSKSNLGYASNRADI